jgi:hypothetical protein
LPVISRLSVFCLAQYTALYHKKSKRKTEKQSVHLRTDTERDHSRGRITLGCFYKFGIAYPPRIFSGRFYDRTEKPLGVSFFPKDRKK